MARKTFLIIGLGLMGGSLALTLRRRFPNARVIGVSRRLSTIQLAKRKRLIHQGFVALEPAVARADYVFVCTPVDTIPQFLASVDRLSRPGTIVTDVGSTKQSIVRWAERRSFKQIHFIGSHPLAGSHETGLKHASEHLYRNALVFLTPTSKTDRSAFKRIASIWRSVGAKPVICSPERHDQIASQISHLPHAVASVLVRSVSPQFLRYGSSGFLDTTRVAQGSPELWTPIFLANRANLARDLKRFQSMIERLIRLLRAGSQKEIAAFLKSASQRRRNALEN